MKKRFVQKRKGMVDHVCGPCKAGGISGTAFPSLCYQTLLQYLLLVRAGHQGQTRLAHITLLPFAQQSLLSGASYFSFSFDVLCFFLHFLLCLANSFFVSFLHGLDGMFSNFVPHPLQNICDKDVAIIEKACGQSRSKMDDMGIVENLLWGYVPQGGVCTLIGILSETPHATRK